MSVFKSVRECDRLYILLSHLSRLGLHSKNPEWYTWQDPQTKRHRYRIVLYDKMV